MNKNSGNKIGVLNVVLSVDDSKLLHISNVSRL